MAITPKQRSWYDPLALECSKTWIDSGALSECFRYEIDGRQWVEKSLLESWKGKDHLIPWIRNEAKILAALSGYPQFVQFYGAYRPKAAWHPRLLILMMEYIAGKTLEAYRGDKTVALSVGYDSCKGLEVMESLDIVHQDLKPGNIIVTADNHGRIIDFGLAKCRGKDLAQAGDIFGTLSYMPPEQAKGESKTAKSDLFSLALVLYETITGEQAKRASSREARRWNLKEVDYYKSQLIGKGMSEQFAVAWGVAVHPVQKERQLEPLKSELENLLKK
ncbi:MAG TPA: protein kinase [Candidatus Nanoarchaeia archaeon]|nr:protein kinase [Candidatus Nanoarchaeia archaeon]